MKRILCYCLILAFLWFAPVKGQSIADLEPIQAIWLSREDDRVVLQADTEDKGEGGSVSEAFENMSKKSSGIIYPDTAQYLLVSENAVDMIPEMKTYLKGKVKVCLWEGGDLSEAAKYMQAHKTGLMLKKWQPGAKLLKLPI